MLQIKGSGEYKADPMECYCAYAYRVSDAFNGDVISSGGPAERVARGGTVPLAWPSATRWASPFLLIGAYLCAHVRSLPRCSCTVSEDGERNSITPRSGTGTLRMAPVHDLDGPLPRCL